jgi:hypothetical protein
MVKTKQFADSARSRPGLTGAFFIDAVGTGMFLPFSLLFFLTTTSLPLTRIGLALSIAAVVRIPVTIAAARSATGSAPAPPSSHRSFCRRQALAATCSCTVSGLWWPMPR